MANEKTISISFTCSKGGASVTGAKTVTRDLSGDKMISGSYDIGTSWEAISFGDIPSGDKANLYFANLDATNYVELATANDGTGIFTVVDPGDAIYVRRLASGTIYARANTAACTCNVVAAAA